MTVGVSMGGRRGREPLALLQLDEVLWGEGRQLYPRTQRGCPTLEGEDGIAKILILGAGVS